MDNNVFETEIPETQEAEVVTETAANPVEATIAKVKALPKALWIGIGAAIVAIIAAIVLISVLTNTYKTPLANEFKLMNTKKVTSIDKLYISQLNGFAEKEVKAVYKAMSKSETFTDYMDKLADEEQDAIDEMKETYGDNYKYSYEITEKEELERSDRNELRDQLKDLGENLKDLVDETKDFDNADWDDLATNLDMTKSEAKALISALKELATELKDVEVTAGYEITYNQTLKGSELEDPEEDEMTMYVYKVNGRWVSGNAITRIYGLVMGFAMTSALG